MPTGNATPFTAIGKGNGFNSCLIHTDITGGNETLLNVPTLAETMNAYWNFKKVTFGSATFEASHEPMDLICNPSNNIGGDLSGDFTAQSALPSIYVKDEVKYYAHGISMSFFNRRITELNNGQQTSTTSITYSSTIYTPSQSLSPYTCTTITAGEDQEPVGKGASEKTETVSSVIISGIPFIKHVTKTFSGEAYGSPLPSCPTGSYPDPVDPTLELYTY